MAVQIEKERLEELVFAVERIRANSRGVAELTQRFVEGETPMEAIDILNDQGKVSEEEIEALEDWYEEN